jgi:nitrogen fixation-related uncharacterized protein
MLKPKQKQYDDPEVDHSISFDQIESGIRVKRRWNERDIQDKKQKKKKSLAEQFLEEQLKKDE